MEYQDILANAKAAFDGKCNVCKVCNGEACRGRIPGCGSKGSGESFAQSYRALQSIRLRMDTLYHGEGQDCSISLFGRSFSAPFFVAPMAAIANHYGNAITEDEYAASIVNGAAAAGTFAFTGDGVDMGVFTAPLGYVKQAGGAAIPTIKPWDMSDVAPRLEAAKEAGAMAVAMDIDSVGLSMLTKSGKKLCYRDAQELAELAKMADRPFIVKGIMTPQAAEKLARAGIDGIVVSNHGGRVLDHAQAPAEVLREIRSAVGDSLTIFVDGAIRTGADVFKVLALGADAAMIGRPYITAAYGGGAQGVEIYTRKVMAELKETMLMTGCKTLSDITYDKIAKS